MSDSSFLEPDILLIQLNERADARKLRRFCCACVRRIWSQIADSPASCHAVEVSERFADGKATLEELREARAAAKEAIDAVREGPARNARRAADWSAAEDMDALSICRSVGWAAAYASKEGEAVERAAQVALLREIFAEELAGIP